MKKSVFSLLLVAVTFIFIVLSCGPSDVEPLKVGGIPDGEMDPGEWGKIYPLEYESWLKTKEPKQTGMTKYKRGWDDDKIIYDKLSEFPFAALLFHGWGFGIEYNEPRGHFNALIDQIEIDTSRTSPGGVCLSCKTPYHKQMVEKHGMKYLKAPFKEAVNMLPEKHRKLGPACVDCHRNDTMGLSTNKAHIEKGLKMIGKKKLTRQESRTISCAQCHISYYVPRDKQGKVAGDIAVPWTGGKWGDISIETIVKDLMTDYKREEWTQKVTGFRMPYIRHPEFEMFTMGSVHWNANIACADCHMPYKRVGAYKISDHDVTSPLKAGLKSCNQCHTESATWLKKQVLTIQDRTISLLNRAGYATATAAKLFEMIHKEQVKGKRFDSSLYNKAKNFYKKAFLRVNFVGAENSTGFHNPTEAARILGDALAYANKTESMLRQMLTKSGVNVPEIINLELKKYLANRGKKKLGFKSNQEFKDPYNTQKEFLPDKFKGL